MAGVPMTDDREQQVRRARVATEMKAGLESLIEPTRRMPG
jgi:hypothetical protein